MRRIKAIIGVAFGVALASAALTLGASMPVLALGVQDLSNQDAAAGLKAALDKGSVAAVAKLGVKDGFLKNPKVKIPLPGPLKKTEKAMRALGMGDQADGLVTAMNRAAEAAVPQAKPLLVDAVKSMSVTDAKNILTGGDDSVTKFFKGKTKKPLAEKFLPLVRQATDKVGLAKKYNAYAGQGVKLGLIKEQDATIEQYVTEKTLDGLYLMIAEEERKIRKDPIGAGSDIIKKVFGALK